MKLKQGLVTRQIDDEYILVDTGLVSPRFNGMIKLNESGKYIVSLLLDNDLTVDDIVNDINKNFDTTGMDINKIVNDFISELSNANLFL